MKKRFKEILTTTLITLISENLFALLLYRKNAKGNAVNASNATIMASKIIYSV